MRIFAAIRPPEQVLAHLHTALVAVHTGAAQLLRWVPPEQWHITVAFHGELPEGLVPDAAETLQETVSAHAAPELILRGAGSFSGRTLWVGVAGGDRTQEHRLRELMAQCSADGYAQPRDRQRAHLTVARHSRRAEQVDLAGLARVLSIYEGPSWCPEEVELSASQLGAGPGGRPQYTTVATAPFGVASAGDVDGSSR